MALKKKEATRPAPRADVKVNKESRLAAIAAEIAKLKAEARELNK